MHLLVSSVLWQTRFTVSEETSPRCLICAAENPSRRYSITRFEVLTCRQCEQIFLDPLLEPDEVRDLFSSLYTVGEGSVPELKDYYSYCFEDDPENPLVQQYEAWLDQVEAVRPPGRVLDIGCGTGLFLAVARRRGWDPFGIDESQEATEHARNHFGLDPWVGEFEAFVESDETFDLVTGWDVIEHSRDPVGLMRGAHSRLKPEGVVALSTPNQRSMLDLVGGLIYRFSGHRITKPLEKFYIEQHFLYFTPQTLRQCMQRAELDIFIERQERTDLRRLSLSLPVRLLLESMFLAGRILGRQNRIFVMARKF
ncbi:class I SAM-dependent methyltransferase [Myxococcota bacterium]|nr:class I SAM-dependent methyltransferase [Myxococcota bacterium]